jgi:hypothetical protein
MEAIQPLFQQRGYAPLMFIRPGLEEDNSIPFQPVTVNHESPLSVLLLARPLVMPGERRGLSEQEIDAFISLCSEASLALDEAAKPKGWFARRRSTSSIVQKPSLPIFDKTREQAVNLAFQYTSLLGNLPNYRRAVRVAAAGLDAHADEMEDFLEFVGFDPQPVAEGTWYEPSICALFQLQGENAWLTLPQIARTPQPETVYENIGDAMRRFAMEFGGEFRDDEQNERVIRGWSNLLAKVKLAPGDEEARELFPFKP